MQWSNLAQLPMLDDYFFPFFFFDGVLYLRQHNVTRSPLNSLLMVYYSRSPDCPSLTRLLMLLPAPPSP